MSRDGDNISIQDQKKMLSDLRAFLKRKQEEAERNNDMKKARCETVCYLNLHKQDNHNS